MRSKNGRICGFNPRVCAQKTAYYVYASPHYPHMEKRVETLHVGLQKFRFWDFWR